MFGAPIQEQYVNRPGTGRATRAGWLIVLMLLLMGGFGWWAYSYEVEEVTRANGRVVPSSQVQSVQTLEGGIVSEIAVAEGDVVTEGQVLLQIDATAFQSELGELTQQERALLGREVRLLAEVTGQEPDFKAAGLDPASTIVRNEAQLFAQRSAQLAQELDILRGRKTQAQADIGEQAALAKKLAAVIEPLEKELKLSQDLQSRGIMPELEVLRLEARLAEERGSLDVANASQARMQAVVEEADLRVTAAQAAARLQAQEALAEVQTNLAVVRETIKSASDRVSRTALRAPVKGTVKTISVNGLGSVLAPGADVVQIVPSDDSLLIEADIQPKDIAFIHPAATASIKISAYDYLIYGSLPATVERISADSFSDAQGRSFFRVFLRTDRGFLGQESDPLPIIPGMVATVDIQTGRKSVLDYLARPLLRAQSEALRER